MVTSLTDSSAGRPSSPWQTRSRCPFVRLLSPQSEARRRQQRHGRSRRVRFGEDETGECLSFTSEGWMDRTTSLLPVEMSERSCSNTSGARGETGTWKPSPAGLPSGRVCWPGSFTWVPTCLGESRFLAGRRANPAGLAAEKAVLLRRPLWGAPRSPGRSFFGE